MNKWQTRVQGGILKQLFPSRNASISEAEKPYNVEIEAFDRYFEYLSSVKEEYGVELIFVYHPMEKLEKDGTLNFPEKVGTETFSEYCESNGITFINMENKFEKMYYTEHHVPHGFMTGRLGAGHLNKYGHKAMANEIANKIRELEGDGKLWQ